ncbi:MAG: beta-propeller fold lactonase family protein [Myxococcales bacterium]
MVLALVATWQVAACDGNDEQPGGGGAATDGGHGGATTPVGAPEGGSNSSGASHAGSGSTAGGNAGEAGSDAAAGNGGAAQLANEGGGGAAGASGSDEGGARSEGGTAGLGGATDEGGAGEISGREFVYVSHILGGIVSCSLDRDGVPTLLPGGPIRPGGHATSLAVHPTQKFVYVADEDKHVYVFPIGADGSLPAEPSSSIATPAYPLSLTIEPQGRFAYVASDQGTAIYGFAIDGVTGALTAVEEPLLVGEGPDFSQPAFIAAEPSGHYVYVSQRAQQGIRGYQIDSSSGTLSELEGSPFAASGLPPGDNLFGGAIVFKASGDFAFTSGGALNAFSLDPRSGALTLVEGSPFTLDVQSDPNAPNLTIDPRGKYLYVSHFLLNNHVSGFAIDPTSGKLEAVPGSPITALAPYSAAIDPSGRFLYIGEDLPETSVYRLSRSSGAMTQLAGSPFMFGGLEAKLAFAVLP